MKKHEWRAKYEAETLELLRVARDRADRLQAANDVLNAEEQLRKSMLAAMDTALSLYSELNDQIPSDFPDDRYSFIEYADEQSLNMLQKCVEMCIPNTIRARPIAYVLYQAHLEGYIDNNVEDFVTKFFDGLESAIKTAERELGGDPYFSYYSSEDEFPSNIPERLDPRPSK